MAEKEVKVKIQKTREAGYAGAMNQRIHIKSTNGVDLVLHIWEDDGRVQISNFSKHEFRVYSPFTGDKALSEVIIKNFQE